MFDPELESFKTSIDLRAYATSQGYVLDAKESWRGAAVMRHPATDDKVIIKRETDGHYVYFSVRDDRDHGTIIDFAQHRLGLSFGALRKELRPWIGKQLESTSYSALPKTGKDRMRVETNYVRTQETLRHPYMENERGIPAELLQSERFAGCIRVDARGNAIFPHFDRQGLSGYEAKNSGFTGFASGGTKGLWQSQARPDDKRLVFCESAIEVLSYAVLFPNDHTRYASIAGQVSPVQRELIRAAIAGMPMNSQIVAAMNADPAGAKLADIVRAAVELSGRDDLCYIFHEPVGFNDWNDQLKARPAAAPLPRRQKEPFVA